MASAYFILRSLSCVLSWLMRLLGSAFAKISGFPADASWYADSFCILSPSAAVSSLFNSSSLEVTMFCFSSIPRMSCSFWYRTSFSWDVSTFSAKSESCPDSQSEVCMVDSNFVLKFCFDVGVNECVYDLCCESRIWMRVMDLYDPGPGDHA